VSGILGPLGTLLGLFFAAVAAHPILSLVVFIAIFGGPVLVWMRSGGGGRHR
jgi:hypothetical protein